ncbi:MAG: hypothetical protein ACR2NH_05800, partial [Solirubrobacteraceae bacterium]
PRGPPPFLGQGNPHPALPAAPPPRPRARRRHALADFVAEHGERGLRALGGRREAQRRLDTEDPALDVPALRRTLEAWAADG